MGFRRRRAAGEPSAPLIRHSGGNAGLPRGLQGTHRPRLQVRRADHRLRLHAGGRNGERPSGDLPLASGPEVREERVDWRSPMIAKLLARVGLSLIALALASGAAFAKITIAIGGAGCLCYLPTLLAEYFFFKQKTAYEIELINFRGG